MTEQRFQELLADEVRMRASDDFRVETRQVEKNNGVVRCALCVSRKEDTMAPTIYLEELYHRYLDGAPLAGLAEKVLQQYDSFAPELIRLNTDFFSDYSKAMPDVRCRLVNARRNRKLLEHTPHLDFLDLALVCYYRVRQEEFPDATILIRENHRLAWGISEETLMRDACRNTRQELTARLYPLWEILYGKSGLLAERFWKEEPSIPLYNLGEPCQEYGAVSIWYTDILQSVALELDSDFFILPSSVHECLILPDDGQYDLEELSCLVQGVNEEFVPTEEVLSGSAYHYSRAAGRIDACSECCG